MYFEPGLGENADVASAADSDIDADQADIAADAAAQHAESEPPQPMLPPTSEGS